MLIREEIRILKNRIKNNLCMNCDDPEWIKTITGEDNLGVLRRACRKSMGHQMQTTIMPMSLAGKELVVAAGPRATRLVRIINDAFKRCK